MAKTSKPVRHAPVTVLVIRDVPPLYRTAFRTLAAMLDLTYADLLVRIMLRSSDPKVREVVPRDRTSRTQPAPARSETAVVGR